jgi:hypothetical protein
MRHQMHSRPQHWMLLQVVQCSGSKAEESQHKLHEQANAQQAPAL